jgi:NAD-dependent dihydropyrimidine dehydrogenase PreA subunit
MNQQSYFPEVLTLQLIQELCNNCGMCVKVCPHEVFEMKNKKVRIIGHDFCMECGACKKNCPQGAILLDVGDGCGCAAGIIQGVFAGTAPTCGGPNERSSVMSALKR